MMMKRITPLFILLAAIFTVACGVETARVTENLPAATPVEESQSDTVAEPVENDAESPAHTAVPEDPAAQEPPEATFTPASETNTDQDEPALSQVSTGDLPMLPPFPEANTNGIGSPLPDEEQDPFAEARFVLAAELSDGPEYAVVQEHTFTLLDESAARAIADQLGFSGPLYVQQIAPEFAPAEDEAKFSIFSAFDGSRILNISDNGVTLEDRGVLVDYNDRPPFATIAPILEAQLKEWGLLDFPYEITDVDDSIVMVHRLIDGIPNNQNEFNTLYNQDGEMNYFDYRPLREITDLGDYPLQTAEMAWQQIQQPAGGAAIRYQIWPLTMEMPPIEGFVNPRSWTPLSDPGQELHLYMTPAVYEATDGSGLRLMYGDFTLSADEEQLAEMATLLADVLHVWGTTALEDGAKTLQVEGWEQVDLVNYETIEGTIQTQEDGQRILQSITGETFILPSVPDDVEDGLEVYASAMARRDTGAGHPLLDWNSLTEKIEWPEMPIATAEPEPGPITEVTIYDVDLIYFTLYETAGVPGEDTALLLLPVWQFSGQSNQDQGVTLWVPAVEPEFFDTEGTAASS